MVHGWHEQMNVKPLMVALWHSCLSMSHSVLIPLIRCFEQVAHTQLVSS